MSEDATIRRTKPTTREPAAELLLGSLGRLVPHPTPQVMKGNHHVGGGVGKNSGNEDATTTTRESAADLLGSLGAALSWLNLQSGRVHLAP